MVIENSLVPIRNASRTGAPSPWGLTDHTGVSRARRSSSTSVRFRPGRSWFEPCWPKLFRDLAAVDTEQFFLLAVVDDARVGGGVDGARNVGRVDLFGPCVALAG